MRKAYRSKIVEKKERRSATYSLTNSKFHFFQYSFYIDEVVENLPMIDIQRASISEH